MTVNKPQAVIFDFDGVLYNSEFAHHQAFCDFLDYYHYHYERSWVKELIGTNPKMNIWFKIYQRLNCDISYEEFEENKTLYLKQVKAYNDVSDYLFKTTPLALKLLKDNGIKLAVASSSAYDYLEYNLKKSKIFDYFDLIYSGRDLEASKPDPLIYQKTAQDLGFDVSECAVIEDSYYGIQAGKRAKMFVIGIKDFNFNIDQSEADILVNDCYEASLFLLRLSTSNKTNNSKADNKNR